MGTIISFIRTALEVYNWLIIIRVFLSWIPHDPYYPIFRFIYEVTEPVLGPIRRMINIKSGLDFSPIIALLLIQVVEYLIISLLKAV